MAVYTSVSGDELDAFLGHYHVGERTEFEGIADGAVNSNFYVSTSGVRAVLTLFERLPANEIPYYLALMAWLSQHGLPSPHPIADRWGLYLHELNGCPAALFQRLAGVWIEQPTPEHCRSVGRTLGRLHAVAAGFPQRRANPYGQAWWRSTGRRLLPELPADKADLLRDELRFQSLHRFEDLPQGPIHGDLFRDNVLFANGRITGIIDFYFACDESLLFDVAITVNDWCSSTSGSLDAERTFALLEAYHEERPLTPIERGAWPTMLRAATLRWWLWRLVDARDRGAGQIGEQKNPEQQEHVLRLRVASHDRLHQYFPAV